MPRPIDPRRTFLHRHIPSELDPPYRSGPGFREEILALELLRHRLGQAFICPPKVVHRLVNRWTFFYDYGDYKLYTEVRVKLADREEDESQHYQDLTNLLSRPAEQRPGVLLAARSGAGKTVAMLKSFHDCFRALPGAEPLLAGHLPCYLRNLSVGLPAVEAAVRDWQPTAALIESLIRRAAGLQKVELGQVRQWLRHTEKLLLFVDLNTAAQDVRPHLAIALTAYQEKYHKQGHRCVVAYRAVARDDSQQALLGGGWFDAYDLKPLPHGTAQKYLDNLGHVENELRAVLAGKYKLSPRLPARDAGHPGAAAAALRSLIDRHVRGGHSLLSTPLLMHFVSMIGAAAAEVRSLAELYAAVVDEYLIRDHGDTDAPSPESPYAKATTDSGLAGAEGRERILTAMTRVALAILADGPEVTRLLPRGKDTPSERVLDDLLASPGTFRHWWPVDAWWHKGVYFRTPFRNKKKRRVLKEFSLLRRDGKVFGFLHDSVLYYFAALAVRCRRRPLLGLSPLDGHQLAEWCGKAVARLHADPAIWNQPAEFLGGMLTWEELAVLMREVLATPPQLGWPDVLLSLARGRRRPQGTDDALLAGVERALLHKRPGVFGKSGEDTALVSEVYHYLRDAARLPPERHEWLDRLQRRLRQSGPTWLYAAERTFWPLPFLRAHRRGVNCVAIQADGRVVSGGSDSRVVLWDQDTGDSQELYCHNGVVSSVAVSGDGRVVVSGGGLGDVRRAVDGVADAKPLYYHKDVVRSVAVSRDGHVVASGGEDGLVHRAVDGVADAEPLYHHKDVISVAVSRDGRVVVSGGYDGLVHRAVDGVADPGPLYRHVGRVFSVAVSEDGRVVAWCRKDGCVHRAVDGVADAGPLLCHVGEVNAVAVSGDGRVVVNGDDYGGCVHRAVDGVADPGPLYRHVGRVLSVAVSEEGRVVASGGEDGCVRRAVDGVADAGPLPLYKDVISVAVSGDGRVRVVASGRPFGRAYRVVDASADAEPLLCHSFCRVPSVAVSEDGRVVVIGDDYDGCVHRTVDGVADAEPLYRHVGRVLSVAVSEDGRVVASGDDVGYVRRAVDGVADAEPLYRHLLGVTSVAVSGGGRVVASCGKLGWVHRAVDGVADAEPLYRHFGGSVLSVAVSRDGRVVASGGYDGYVLRAVDGVADAEPLLCHGHPCFVRSVAVSGDGRVVASGGEDGCVRRAVDGVADAEPLYRHEGRARSVAVSRDGRLVASGGDDAAIRLWLADHSRPLVFLSNAAVHQLCMTTDGRRVVARLANNEILTLDLVIPDGASSGGLG